MNFSKLKLNESIAKGDYTGLSAEKATSGLAAASSQNKFNRNNEVKSAKTKLSSQPVGTKNTQQTVMSSHIPDVDKYFQEMRQEVERIKTIQSQKSDWRTELQEKAVDGQEREGHPFVTVMPTGDEALIQAMKQMGGEAQEKKKKLQASGVDVNLQKEELEVLEEKKKKGCKDGYKRDEDGNCVKKEKSKTVIMGRGYGYGHHHHDHDETPDEGGDGDGGGDGGGGMGEMFDILGDMLLKEKTLSIEDQMRISREAAKNRNPNPDHRKLNADRVKGYVPPKTSDKDRAKD